MALLIYLFSFSCCSIASFNRVLIYALLPINFPCSSKNLYNVISSMVSLKLKVTLTASLLPPKVSFYFFILYIMYSDGKSCLSNKKIFSKVQNEGQ